MSREYEPGTIRTEHVWKRFKADQQRMLLTKALGSFGIAFGALGRGSSYINGVNVYLCTLWLTTDLGEVNLSTRAQGGPWTEACR